MATPIEFEYRNRYVYVRTTPSIKIRPQAKENLIGASITIWHITDIIPIGNGRFKYTKKREVTECAHSGLVGELIDGRIEFPRLIIRWPKGLIPGDHISMSVKFEFDNAPSICHDSTYIYRLDEKNNEIERVVKEFFRIFNSSSRINRLYLGFYPITKSMKK